MNLRIQALGVLGLVECRYGIFVRCQFQMRGECSVFRIVSETGGSGLACGCADAAPSSTRHFVNEAGGSWSCGHHARKLEDDIRARYVGKCNH